MVNQEGKTNWMLVAIILAVTVFVGIGITAYINQTKQSLSVKTDSAPADKQVANENYKSVALKDVVQYVDENKNNYVETVGTVSDIKYNDEAGSILLSDNAGYYVLVNLSHADITSGTYKIALDQIKKGDIIQVGGVAGFTAPADWFFEKSFTENRQLPEKIGMVELAKNVVFLNSAAQTKDAVSVLMEDIRKTTQINFSELQPAEFDWITGLQDGKINIANGLGFQASKLPAEKAQLIRSYFTNKGFSTNLSTGSKPIMSSQGIFMKDKIICKINDQAGDQGGMSGSGSVEVGVPKGMEVENINQRSIDLRCAELVK